MKKALSLIIILALCFSIAACGSSEGSASTTAAHIETTAATTEATAAPTTEATVAPTESALSAIEAYVEANKAALLASMEESFATSSGMTCTSDIEVINNGIVITININELDNLEQSLKDQMQTTYDAMDTTFEGLLTQLQATIPEVEYLTINVCEVDGDLIATITADGTVSEGQSIEEFVAANKADLLASMEESFASSSGYTCTSDIQVVGNGFVISININELNDMDQATKDQLQTTYDSMADTFEGLLVDLQQMVPSLEYYTILVNEADGDNLATITAGEK